MEKDTIQFQRKRRFLLFLPLLIIPIGGLTFYALGGGKADKEKVAVQKGINASLPGATFQKQQGAEDKMALYEKQKRDSINAKQQEAGSFIGAMGFDSARINKPDENAAQIKTRLAQLQTEMNRPQPAAPAYSSVAADAQTKKLQQIVEAMKHSNGSEDPEMKQLDGLMSKLLDLQHPERVTAKLRGNADSVNKHDTAFHAIPAIIDGSQKVAPGGVVKLKLSDTLHLGNLTIPKGQLLFGACNITNQRLLLDIRNIRLGTAIIPVNLTVFSLDGLAGINAPEAELGEAAGNGTANALQSMEFLSYDQSLGTQAASAGISAAKNLLSKKAKRIRVKLKGGQPVLLRINKN